MRVIDSSGLRLLQNNSRGEILLRPAQQFDRVKITLNSSLLGLLTTFRLYYAWYKPRIPVPVTADSTAVCAGGTTTLTADGGPNAIIRWYDAPTGGTLLATGSNFAIKPAVTTTYYVTATVNGCTSARKAVKVTVQAKPVNPVYTLPEEITCGNTTFTVSNYQPGTSYQVHVKYTGIGGLNKDTSYTVTSSPLITIKDIAYYFNANVRVGLQAISNITGCKSDTIFQSLVQGGHATYVRVPASSVTICKGDSTTLTAFLQDNPVDSVALIRWYDAPIQGRLLFTGHRFKVAPATTTTYYVTAAFQCENPIRTPVKVIVTKLPDPVYTVPQGIVCGTQQFPLLNHQAGFNYRVKVVYSSFSGPYYDTTYLVVNKNFILKPAFYPATPANVNIYVQAIDPASGCRSDTVKKSYNEGAYSVSPTVGADSTSICRGDTATLYAFQPFYTLAEIRWYDAPTGGNLLYTGKYFKVSPAATQTYYAASAFECEHPQRKPVNVKVIACSGPQPAPQTKSYLIPQDVFPNPTAGQVYFSFHKNLTNKLVLVYDRNGKLVQQERLRTNNFYLQPQLPDGIYFIKVMDPQTGESSSTKIILQR
nr:T9SS type A sorting domain-containing protein [Chitinophaga nivalis]